MSLKVNERIEVLRDIDSSYSNPMAIRDAHCEPERERYKDGDTGMKTWRFASNLLDCVTMQSEKEHDCGCEQGCSRIRPEPSEHHPHSCR